MIKALSTKHPNPSIKRYIAVSLIAAALLVPAAHSQSDAEDTFTLNLKDADIHSLIETVSSRTGMNFIVDPRVRATVTVISSKPINGSELYDIFLSILDVHGYAAVTVGEMTKIVPTATGVQSPVPLLHEQPSEEQPASGDQLSTRVINVENIPVQQMVEALAPLLPKSASLSAEANSNAIVITTMSGDVSCIRENGSEQPKICTAWLERNVIRIEMICVAVVNNVSSTITKMDMSDAAICYTAVMIFRLLGNQMLQ